MAPAPANPTEFRPSTHPRKANKAVSHNHCSLYRHDGRSARPIHLTVSVSVHPREKKRRGNKLHGKLTHGTNPSASVHIMRCACHMAEVTNSDMRASVIVPSSDQACSTNQSYYQRNGDIRRDPRKDTGLEHAKCSTGNPMVVSIGKLSYQETAKTKTSKRLASNTNRPQPI